MSWTARRVTVFTAGALSAALFLTACGSDDDGTEATDDDSPAAADDDQMTDETEEPDAAAEPVELTIATFGTFGYDEAGLFDEYMQLNPHVTITHNNTGDGGPYHEDMLTKLAAGSGLADIAAIEEGHIGKLFPQSDKFNDLNEVGPDTTGRWLDWKSQVATDADGRLIGYGTDIGPLAICYRQDLFAEAGLPSEPGEVESLFETWESYFDAGDQFVADSDAAWFDSATQIFNAMVNQLPEGFTNENNELIIEDNAAIREAWDMLGEAVANDQSAKLPVWSTEWDQGFANSAFATQACPPWMLGVIEARAGEGNAGNWAVADAFPNGGGNWGGAWLTVPTESQHPEEAAALAAWLTAPEQQIKVFAAAGPFPSQVDGLASPDLLGTTNEYFGGQQIGELFAARAEANGQPQHKSPWDGAIQEGAASPSLQAVEAGTSPEDGWNQFVDEANRIVE
jgi:cellobiose transport system substrate-binding protein